MAKVTEEYAQKDDALRFIAFDSRGKETDWIDPVIGFTEYDDYWAVENSYSTYLVPRSAGATYKIEPISDGDAA